MKGKGKIMNSILEQIKNVGIIPVIEIEYLKNAVPLADALWEGGLRCVEITFRTSIAAEAIRLIKKAYPEMLIGAGTILTKEQVDEAIDSGAEFTVSPGFDPEIVDFCVERKRVILPGCVTASEIVQAVKRGLEAVKFFPAEPAGGLKMLKALAGPYPSLKFMPTGGINVNNVESYLGNKHVLACGGSWIAKKELISNGDFETIRKLSKDAAEIVKKVRK